MKSLDTTRLNQRQLEILAMIIRSIDDRQPGTMLGQRMRLSNLVNKGREKNDSSQSE